MPHLPIRTCVACGAKRAKSLLIRLGELPNGTVGTWNLGRGAYVCTSADCMAKVNIKKLAWVLRLGRVPVDLRINLPESGSGEPTN